MESQRAADDGRWDVLRLQDVCPVAKEGAVYGKHTHFQPRERQHANTCGQVRTHLYRQGLCSPGCGSHILAYFALQVCTAALATSC